MYLVLVAVTAVSRGNQSGMTLPYLYCWHRKYHICDKQIYAFRLATFSWVSSHPPSQFRRRPLARKLFSAVLFEWPKRKHVPLPVIAWNGKKFAAAGSRLLFRPLSWKFIMKKDTTVHHFYMSSNWNTSAALQPSLTELGMYLSNTAPILR